MNAADPHFESRVRQSFDRQAAMRTLGAAIESVEPGRVVVAMLHREELTQQHGFLHAGMLAAALDSACGYAAFSLMPADAAVLTIEFKINLLAPATGDRIVAEGFAVKPGRTLAVTRAEVHAERDGRRTLIAVMQQTLMVMHGKADE